MKFQINEDLCEEKGISLSEIFLALAVRNTKDFLKEVEDMQKKQIISIDKDGTYIVNPSWNTTIDEILVDSTPLKSKETFLKELAEAFSKTFPEGKMPNTSYYYRCNKRELVLKFKKFFYTYPEYKLTEETKERIVKAATRYNQEQDANPKYRMLAKYFIGKNKKVIDEDGSYHVEEVSPLATYLENENSTDSYISVDDWLMQTRN